MIQFAERCDPRAHQTAGVEYDPYGLTFFEFVEARDQFSATGCGGPADVAKVVAILIFAEAFESAARSANSAEAFFECSLATSNQVNSMAFGFEKVRIDGNSLPQVRRRPALRDAKWPLVSKVDL
jgi:hypothetical protein